jgi:predicted transcriptional regulator
MHEKIYNELYDGQEKFVIKKTKQKIFNLIQENNRITIQAIADELNMAKRAIDKNIKILKEQKIIKRTGSNKTGHWEIIDNFADQRKNRKRTAKSKIKNQVLYSSNSDLWETPQYLFDELNREFHFDLDVCATKENTKCDKYFTPETDGLNQAWQGNCFMNPPYGREIYKWIKKAYDSSLHGTVVVCLLPARTDTK